MIAYDGSFPKLDCQKLADATLTEVELSKEGDAKYFSYFKSSDMIEVHFGLFGVVFGKATSKRK